jgi:hypothetical protein
MWRCTGNECVRHSQQQDTTRLHRDCALQVAPFSRFVLTVSLQVALNVFDTRSGRKLRIFGGNMEDYAIGSSAGPGGALRWPIFK